MHNSQKWDPELSLRTVVGGHRLVGFLAVGRGLADLGQVDELPKGEV